MQKAYVQVGVEDFFNLCMTGPSTTSLANAFATSPKLDHSLNFDDVPTGSKDSEASMYGPLVSRSIIFHR